MASDGYKRMSPCRFCADRSVGCHGTCKDYIEWAENTKELKRNERVSRIKVLTMSDFTGTSPKPGKTRWKKR